MFQRHFAPRACQILQEIEHRQRQQQQQRGGSLGLSGPRVTGQQQQQQLPVVGLDVEQQYRQQQQQVELAAAAAESGPLPRQQQQQGGGIIAVAHVPSAAAFATSDLAGSSFGSGNHLLGSSAAAAAAGDSYSQWAPEYGSLGSDYNIAGPHTLGDVAASIEWAPNIITASPATLAASHTKRQLKAPLSSIRGGGLGPLRAAAAAGLGGQHGSGERAGFARYGEGTQFQHVPLLFPQYMFCFFSVGALSVWWWMCRQQYLRWQFEPLRAAAAAGFAR